jgi:hypothetical protein
MQLCLEVGAAPRAALGLTDAFSLKPFPDK